MTEIQLVLFYKRDASKPYLLKGPSIKQYRNGPDPRQWGCARVPWEAFWGVRRVCAEHFSGAGFLSLLWSLGGNHIL